MGSASVRFAGLKSNIAGVMRLFKAIKAGCGREEGGPCRAPCRNRREIRNFSPAQDEKTAVHLESLFSGRALCRAFREKEAGFTEGWPRACNKQYASMRKTEMTEGTGHTDTTGITIHHPFRFRLRAQG